MNKLFTKIVGAALGLTMAIGVGVAVASNREATPAHATPGASPMTSVFNSKSWGVSSGDSWSSTTAGAQFDSTRGVQVTKGNSGVAVSSETYSNISKITVTGGSASKGVGSIKVKVGSGTEKTWSVSKGTADTAHDFTFSPVESGKVTLTVSANSNTASLYCHDVTITYSASSKTLSSIAVKTAPKTTYTEGETFDPTGLVITRNYTNPSSSDTYTYANHTSEFSFSPSTLTELSTSDTKVTITYGGKSCDQAITVTAAPSGGGFELITAEQADWSGTYLIANVSGSTAYVWTGIDAAGCNVSTTISNNAISKPSGAQTVTITSVTGGYTIKVDGGTNKGKYMYGASGSGGSLAFSTDAQVHTISYSSSSVSLAINSKTLRYNSGRFRYYGSGQSPIQLFKEASSETTTALSVTPTSWSGYDSDTLDISDFTITCTTSASSDGYVFQGIGSGSDENFVARVSDFTSGHPTTSDTRLQWKAKYPTTAGGSTYLYAAVTLTVTADSVSSIAITGTMTKTGYYQNDPWDPSGFTVNAYYASAPSTPVDVTSNAGLNWSYDPATTASLSTNSVTCTATFGGKSSSKVQPVTVSAAPVSIIFGSGSGQWKPTASGSTFEDSKGNTATLTTDTSYFGTSRPIQVGKNDSGGVSYRASYVDIIIPLSAKAGIDNVSATFKSNGASTSVTLYIYGDTDNDLLASGTVTGNSTLGTVETASSYEKINASRLKYHFVIGGTGVMLDELKYTLGSTVTDFGPMVDLDILTPASNTQFKEGDTFSGTGLVLQATDSHEPPMTKNLTSGFKFGTSQGDDSFTNHVFDASDAATGTFTVYVTATVGSVTMSVTYTITVTEVPTYSPVSDYSSLYEGAKVIIVAGESAFGEFGVNQGGVVSPVFTDGNVTDANGATEFTVRIFGNRFGLKFGEYYLALNGDNNQVHRNLELNDAGSWTKDSSGISSSVEGRYLALDTNKFVCLKTGGVACSLFISDKAPKTDILGAETFAYKYLHMRDYDPELHEGVPGAGYCSDSTNHYYNTAKDFYNSASFSAEEKVEFAKLTDAVRRLQAWAIANGESFDPSLKTFSSARISPLANIVGNTNTIAVIVVISMISITCIGGYFFLRKRKEN